MTVAQQTWRCSVSYTVPKAGATATMSEILAAIKAMFDAEDVIGDNYWTVSHYSAVNGTLEIKRKGSPTGKLATYRALLFGGSAPNAAALNINPTVPSSATNWIYVGSSEDANTTGPTTAYTAGAPYSVTYNRAIPACPYTTFTTTNAATISLVECDEVFAIVALAANSESYSVVCFCGAIVAKHDDTVVWGHASSAMNNGSIGIVGAVVTDNDALTSGFTSYSRAQLAAILNTTNPTTASDNWPPTAVVWDGGVSVYTGRIYAPYNINTIAADNPLHTITADDIVLLPIHLAKRPLTSPYYLSYLGTLRQMKHGPNVQGKNRLVKVDTTTRGFAFGRATALDVEPLIFDNEP